MEGQVNPPMHYFTFLLTVLLAAGAIDAGTISQRDNPDCSFVPYGKFDVRVTVFLSLTYILHCFLGLRQFLFGEHDQKLELE